MDNTTSAATWTDSSRKSAVGIARTQCIHVFAMVLLYVNSYKAIRLVLLEESDAILATLADGVLLFAVASILYLALMPVIVGRWANKLTVAEFLNGLRIGNRFLSTPLTASVSASVISFLGYAGLKGLILLLAGKPSFGFMDFTIFLAAIPISVALSYPISHFATRSACRQIQILEAQA